MACVALMACSGNTKTYITAAELLRQVQGSTPPVIVDVRSSYEYNKGHVPGAIHIPFYLAWSRSSLINAQADEPVVVYCQHGPRAGIAKLGLIIAGFDNIQYMEGHMSGWYKLAYPVEVPIAELPGSSVIKQAD